MNEKRKVFNAQIPVIIPHVDDDPSGYYFYQLMLSMARSHFKYNGRFLEEVLFDYIKDNQSYTDKNGAVIPLDFDSLKMWEPLLNIPNDVTNDPFKKQGELITFYLTHARMRHILFKGSKLLDISEADFIRRILKHWAIYHTNFKKYLSAERQYKKNNPKKRNSGYKVIYLLKDQHES